MNDQVRNSQKNYKPLLKKSLILKSVIALLLGFALQANAELMSLAGSVRVGSGAGGKIGSGAGGIAAGKFLSTSSEDGDVVVPYPGIVPSADSLIVHGVAGAEQSDDVTVSQCKTDYQGRLIAFSCGAEVSGKLNKSLSVEDGLLLVMYSNSSGFYKKEAGKVLHINLKKISVPKASEPITFDVFADYTSPVEWQKLSMGMYGNNENESFLKNICSESSTENKNICLAMQDAIKNNDFNKYTSTTIRINQKAERLFWDMNNNIFVNRGRGMITDPKDGEFVSVLPGVYGIEWKNSAGDKSSQYGIKVD